MEFCALSGQSGREDGRMRGLSLPELFRAHRWNAPGNPEEKKKKNTFFFLFLLTDSINLDH